jgi:hypothetical protein
MSREGSVWGPLGRWGKPHDLVYQAEMEADWDYSYEAELKLRNHGKSDDVPV